MIVYLIKAVLFSEQCNSRLNNRKHTKPGKRHPKSFFLAKCVVISTFKCISSVKKNQIIMRSFNKMAM